MIKIFHTADIHLGVENYGKIDSKTGIHSRLLDFKNSIARSVQDAIAEKCDLFLFCGDAYKTAYPTPTQQKLLMEEFFKLYIAKIPVVIIVGNHDHPLSFGKANSLDVFADLPIDGFHLFSKPSLVKIETKSGPVQVVGIPWPTRNNLIAKDEHRLKTSEEITKYLSEKVGEIIASLAQQVDKSIPAVLAGHLTASDGVFSGSEKRAIYGNDPTFMISQLAHAEFDYVALGHLHRFQNLNEGNFPAVVYSGSPERVDFGERSEEKGYCKILIDENLPKCKERVVLEFIPLKTRPFIQIEVVLQDGIDQTEQLLAELAKHEIKDAIVKIIYHVPDGKIDKIDLNAIFRACDDAIHLVGIFPIRNLQKIERRAAFKVDMGFEEIVEKYLENREEKKEDKERILQKSRELYAESLQSIE
ncbi:TPA: hypothetical protein DEO28_04450 [Candidatus Dependentiae bacterium]|nr:MAG: Nuclease SbcCD, D subunit [candidate division TM6 bacterium GW2011_GWE2_31_21]KKP53805.1 MAG: Nuclease SbcCD, D subunit [candidate division TM6 bacterium GW2011_GWF2_33_332]HBS47585.1 hypothetical protein [Candidatus Dependentiae bacterium]HBZ73734.1 hypothetical protein [Candidatus Dependentiae bacterium]